VAPISAVAKPGVAFSVPRAKTVATRSWRRTRRSVASARQLWVNVPSQTIESSSAGIWNSGSSRSSLLPRTLENATLSQRAVS